MGRDGDDGDGDAPVGREGYPWQRAALRRESLCLEFHNKDDENGDDDDGIV